MSLQKENILQKNGLLSFLPRSPYLIAYLVIFIVLWETKGMSDAKDTGFPIATSFLIGVFILLVIALFYKRKVAGQVNASALECILLAEFVFFCYANFSPHHYIFNYTKITEHLFIFNLLFYASLLVFVLACLLKKHSLFLYQLLVFISVLFSISIIYCSIETGIDTHIFLNMASDYFLQFKNPYNYNYPDIYNGRYTDIYGDKYLFIYWPLSLYICSIFKLIFNDVRYAFVLAQVIFAFILIKHRHLLNLKNVLVISLIWLLNLVVLFVNERSWIDALVAPFFIYALLLIQNKKFFWAAILLGLMASIKLYYIFALPFFVIYFFKEKKIKEIFIIALAFVSSFIPYLIFSFDKFYYGVIVLLNDVKIREDSLSLVSVIKRIFDVDVSFIGFITMFVSMGLFFFLYYKSRNNILNVVKYINLTFFVIFLCAKQSFCNYFYFNMLCAFITFYLESNFDYEEKKQHGVHI